MAAPPPVSEQPVLLYSWLCPYVHRVTLALALKGASIPKIDIDLDNKPSWLTQYSPLGKVPAITYLEDGNQQVLYESLALVHWVDEYFSQQGPALLPDSPAQRTRARIVMSRYDNNAVSLFYQALRCQDPDQFKTILTQWRSELTWLEDNTHLAKDPTGFLWGPEPNMVDCAVAPWLLRLCLLQQWRNVDMLGEHPKLKAYVERFRLLPQVQSTMPSPQGNDYASWQQAIKVAYTKYALTELDFSGAAANA